MNMNFDIHRFKEVTSTNTILKEFAQKGAKEGTVIVAETQTQGRGRGKNSWHSPPGGLYFSLLLKAPSIARAAELSIVAGVGAIQAVGQLLPKSCDVTLKWPNDCLVNGKKVGGILCETIDDAGRVAVGIGLNLTTSAADLASFQSGAFPATSFTLEIGPGNFDRAAVLDMFLHKLGGIYELYQKEGFDPVRSLWERNSSFLGKRIEFTDSRTPGAQGGQRTVGQFLGIAASGAIVIATESGEKAHFLSGEITCYWPST